MVQLFKRNQLKAANEDIKELVFWITEEKMQITYHTGQPKIIASTREFAKPQGVEEKGAPIIMTADMHNTFQVGATSPPLLGFYFPNLLSSTRLANAIMFLCS